MAQATEVLIWSGLMKLCGRAFLKRSQRNKKANYVYYPQMGRISVSQYQVKYRVKRMKERLF